MTLSWLRDPTPDDYADLLRAEWEPARIILRDVFPDPASVVFAPVVHGGDPRYMTLEVEDGPALVRFSDIDGDLSRPADHAEWLAVISDEDGQEVHELTHPDLATLAERVRVWLCGWTEEQRIAAADDPDRAHDSREG